MRSGVFAVTGVLAAALLVIHLAFVPSVRADEGSASFPDGYRAWTFLHSSLAPAGFPGFAKHPCTKPCTNGIFYFYANDQAKNGLRTGTYADGSIIAEEMLEYLVGEKGSGKEGARVLTAVMVKDSRRYAATGGWGFGNFDEGSKANTLDAKAQRKCFQCHVARKDHAYVFSQYADR
jgi:hypothetical protein